MTAVEWKIGDRGRVGDAEFEVHSFGDEDDIFVDWMDGTDMALTATLLAAMGAVRIPPPVPPTIGTPQSVKDCPPPRDVRVLAWTDGYGWISIDSAYMTSVEWWMPMPDAPPPGVTP